MLGEHLGRELSRLDVAFVQFRVLLPLLGQVVQREDRGHRADRHAGAAIDAFHRVNIELGNAIECRPAVVIRRVLLGVDAIYGTGVDAGGVFGSDAGFGNDRTLFPHARSGRARTVVCSAAPMTWKELQVRDAFPV